MHIVIQEEESGCGIAAVATIAGTSYAEMRRIANAMGIHASDTALWSDTGYVRRLLAAMQIDTAATEQPFTSWDALPDLALLPIKHHRENGREFWHWVVFSRQDGCAVVRDSASYLASNLRTDFEAMHPRWYIRVDSQ